MAALEGVRQVWPAVLASTMTTVLVFAPILFIEQEAGQLYSDVAIAISASILASHAGGDHRGAQPERTPRLRPAQCRRWRRARACATGSWPGSAG